MAGLEKGRVGAWVGLMVVLFMLRKWNIVRAGGGPRERAYRNGAAILPVN